jgi:hypothetical protein
MDFVSWPALILLLQVHHRKLGHYQHPLPLLPEEPAKAFPLRLVQ